jgi:ABC-type transport system substrate-binding protein
VQFAFVTGNATASALGLLMQQQLHGAGVELTLRPYNPTQFRAPAADGGPLYSGKFQLAFLEIYTPADPDTLWYFACSELAPNGFNTSRYCDPVTDRAAEAGASTYDPALRRHFATVVQRRVAAALPSIPLWQENAVYVVPASLRNFRPAAESPVWNVGRWAIAPPRS